MSFLVLLQLINCVLILVQSEVDEDCMARSRSLGGYSHPDWWCSDTTMCADAPDESPIAINTNRVVNGNDEGVCDEKLGSESWDVALDHSLFRITNTGHSVQITPEQSSIYEVAVLDISGTPLRAVFEIYCLQQFHIHWGSNASVGSEHTIDGKSFPLEVHFVHFACELGSFAQAQKLGVDTAQSNPDRSHHTIHTLAVVSVLFEISEEDNPAFDVILQDSVLEDIQEYNEAAESPLVAQVILDSLIPETLWTDGYYAYQGSLTTPPCTDDVNWIISKALGTISEAQLAKFRTIMDEDQKPILRNWRSPQNTFNTVTECDAVSDSDDDSDGDDSDR